MSPQKKGKKDSNKRLGKWRNKTSQDQFQGGC